MTTPRESAIKAARQAGLLVSERLGRIRDIDYKGAYNIVTDVDRDSEELIVSILRSDFPDFGLVGEEGGEKQAGSPRRWLVDPIDGTTNYTHGYPFFSISIALEEAGRMVLGVVYNPLADELFWAEEGKGAWLNDRRLAVSAQRSLATSLLATGFPADTRAAPDDNMIRFFTLTDLSHGVRRDGSAALDLCFVAAGRLDGFRETKLSPWDVAAGIAIVSEAGGRISDLSGQPFDIRKGHILATNGLIHDEVVAVLESLKGRRLAEIGSGEDSN